MRALSEDIYKKFSDFLEVQCGIVLGGNKQYLVKSRLIPLMDIFAIDTLTNLINEAMSYKNRSLRTAVIDAMTTNETLWFRDRYPFELLSSKMFPEILKNKKSIKMWSAASSSGQEAYSIAMTAAEYQKQKAVLGMNVQIIGTDISNTMLEQCKAGIYDTLALSRGLSDDRKRKFFDALPDGSGKMQIKADVKKMTSFRSYNLLDSYAGLGKFDIIFCRNVLIYFSGDVKSKILNQFAGALNPGGYLVLGASESITALTDKFNMVRCNPGIIYQLKDK
ncbi:chemotaxis protein CheR [Psychromonas sp. CNPT3]|uniref:CheR family methyltransferase n=1 Tax=Psychromonas sp. CNPT3 TaxID=314282 RepID=UPI00006E348E|nr:protein-glutamate O-methyltransferase CheR [Psychromonas sp. CNPT3]AGH80565.1 chemotaxis protein CheR [Psychromonas sp. CNPT3]